VLRGEFGEPHEPAANWIEVGGDLVSTAVGSLVRGIIKYDPVQDKLRHEFALREQPISQLKAHDLYTLIEKFMDPNKSLQKILDEYPVSKHGIYVAANSNPPIYVAVYP
jgi:hypothetical protein